MRTPAELEIFFDKHLPKMKAVIEELWQEDRQEASAFLRECYTSGFVDSWMQPYFYDLYLHSRSSSHEYTDPWQVL